MIRTNNAYFLHIPKTAGTWVRNVLQPITVGHIDRWVPPDDFKHDHVYAFVRNPWEWYFSVFNFLNHGSELMLEPKKNFFRLIGNPKSFDEFVVALCDPKQEVKSNLLKFYRIHFKNQLKETDNLVDFDAQLAADPHGIIYSKWVNNNVSFYEQIASVYLNHCTRVGKYETVRQDLIAMLSDSNELTDEIQKDIDTRSKLNVTVNRDDYRLHYNTKTIELVEQTSQFLSAYNYKFE